MFGQGMVEGVEKFRKKEENYFIQTNSTVEFSCFLFLFYIHDFNVQLSASQLPDLQYECNN